MENSATNTCPRCGASLEGVQVEGLCARCLGLLNIAPDTVLPGGAAAGSMDFSREDLEESFPQLEILEVLGRGGMGVVYKARQKQLGRVVALKLLPPERVADPQFAERFRREAQALASLNHPNIVAIHDFGQTNGLFFLLMEFVDGVNLRQAMNAGRFTPAQALAIVPPVCDALQFAHEHGIVHRDIKPENLLLDKRGHIKIADFGIAKMLGQKAASSDFAESQPAGTPQYMAPEQQQSGETDHRADIYSLGVVLYEMLTGELPGSRLQPPSRRIEIDVRIDQLVLRALEKTPEMRFATAAEFRKTIETITREEKSRHPSYKKPPYFSRLALLGAACAAICLVSLPFFEMALVGGLASAVLGWLAISEIQRSEGRVHGLRLAVFAALLFPLLTVNAVLVATYARFVSPIRNQPYPAMVGPSWPFIVIGLGLLTLLLVGLLDFLVVRAVWRRFNKSLSPSDSSTPLLNWRMAAGSFVAMGGVAVMLAAPVINEFIDDFAITKTARYYQQEHQRVSKQWSNIATAAADAVVALDIAKKAQNAAEIARLTQASEALRQSAAHAETAVNQVAVQKEMSERQRLAIFYLIGGGLIVGGLSACVRMAGRNNTTKMDHAAGAQMTGTATLLTREELASAWNQCFCYRTRGALLLDEHTLTHTYAGGTTSIPLEAIRDVSIGRLPRLMNPAGLNVLSIRYEDDGETRQVLVSPIEGWFQYSQQAVTDWFAAIRKAVVAATGGKPSTTPPEQLGIPQSSRLLIALLFIAPALCLLALYSRYVNEARQVATQSESAATSSGPPLSPPNSRNYPTVLAESAAQDEPATPADPRDPTSDLEMRSYDFGFAFTGAGKEARLRDDVRLAIEQFVQKVDAEVGRTPDVRMDPETRILTLTGPPEQQRVLADIVVELKKAVTAAPSPMESRPADTNDPEPTFLKRPEDARVNIASSPKFDARVFVYCADPITSEIVDHHNDSKEVVLSVGARDGVRFGHAFQIHVADSKEHVGVVKVVELESTRCVAKVVSIVPNGSVKSLKGMTAVCTTPPTEEGRAEVKKHFSKEIWQTESLENKLIRELLQAHGNDTRILIIHQ